MPKINKWIYEILLVLLIAFHFINNYIWLSKDCVSLGCDVVHHLNGSLIFYHRLKNIVMNNLGIENFLDLFKAKVDWWPKFIYFPASAISLLFGNTNFVVRLSNMVYFTILITFTYLLGKMLLDKKVGLFSAFMVSFYPGLFGISRKFSLDFPLTAMVCLGIYVLLKTDNFKNKKYSIIFGVVSGLGILTKATYIFFILAPLFYILYKIFFKRFVIRKEAAVHFFNFLISICLSILISSVWWFGRLGMLWKTFWGVLSALYGYFPGKDIDSAINVNIKVFSFKWVTFFFFSTIRIVSPFFFVIFLIGAFYFLGSKRIKEKILIGSWIFTPYIIFTLISLKFDRYYFPSYPAIALVSAIGILQMRFNIVRRILIILILTGGMLQFFRATYGINLHSRFLTSIVGTQDEHEWDHIPEINNHKKIIDGFMDIIERENPLPNPLTVGIIDAMDWHGIPTGDWHWRLVYFMRLRHPDVVECFPSGNICYAKFFFIVTKENKSSGDPDFDFLYEQVRKRIVSKEAKLLERESKNINVEILAIEETMEILKSCKVLKKDKFLPEGETIFLLKNM